MRPLEVRRKFGSVEAAACICSAQTFYTRERRCGCVRRMFFAYVGGRKSKDGAKVRQSLPKSGPQVCQSPEQPSQLTSMFFNSCPIENKRLPTCIIIEQALKHYLAGELRFGENDSWRAPHYGFSLSPAELSMCWVTNSLLRYS